MSSAHTHTIGAVDARSANINDICGDQINNNNNVNNISVEISFLPIRNQPPVASASSCTIDNDDHSRSFNDLQNQDIHSLVDTFIQSNAGQPLVGAVVSLLDKIAAKTDLRRLINELLSTLTDPQIYNGLLNALKAHIEVHPWSTAFLVIGIVLLCNPLAMGRLDFGSLDPVAGSLAAAWRSSMGGTVAAQSAFAILEKWGTMYSVIIPVAGTIITAGSVAAGTAGEQIKEGCNDAWVIANAGAQEIERWNRGEYGNPVTDWWNGEHGDAVTRWWKGEYGAPVAGWANSVKQN